MATSEKSTGEIATAQIPESLPELQKALESLNSATFHEIGIDFHSTRSRRSLQLLGNKDVSRFVPSRHDWFGYEFKEVLYLSSVEATVEGFGENYEFELSVIDAITGIEKTLYADSIDNKVKFNVGKFALGFGFRPPSRIWASPKLISIDAYGLLPSEINQLTDQFIQVAAIRDRVMRECQIKIDEAAEAHKGQLSIESEKLKLEEQIDELTSNIETAKLEIDGLEVKIKDQTHAVETTNTFLAEKQTAISALEDQIEKKSEERKNLNQEVAGANSKLSELKRDIHLFPSEIAGYVRQAARNVWVYVGLSLIPFFIMSAVTFKLFTNSERLLSAFLANPQIPIVDYLLSRLPYAAVSAVILTVCYTLLHRLFAEIININRRKQDLFKVSIIATDVSFASQQGLDLDEDESYNLRTQTKMELLKEHLAQHISDDYVYGKHSGIVARILERARAKLDRSSLESEKPLQE